MKKCSGSLGGVLGCGALVLLAACWSIGEPTPGPALVTWAAYPDTVVAGQTFSFEFAGPVAPTTCGRLDTATLVMTDSSIELSARRSTFRSTCAKQHVSFYEARPLIVRRAGHYRVRTTEGLALGTLVAVDSGRFTFMRAIGDGTLETAGGCTLFGPGWLGNQRPFALRRVPKALVSRLTKDEIVHVEGRLIGFSLCGRYGSRPVIRVDTAWVTGRRVTDYY